MGGRTAVVVIELGQHPWASRAVLDRQGEQWCLAFTLPNGTVAMEMFTDKDVGDQIHDEDDDDVERVITLVEQLLADGGHRPRRGGGHLYGSDIATWALSPVGA